MDRARKARRNLVRFHPSKGAAVIFSSGWENMHEVEKLTSGTRYAVPSFFTTSPVPEMAYTVMVQGKPKTDEDIADDWLHLLLAHRHEKPAESVGRVKELLMKWHMLCTPLDRHAPADAGESSSPVSQQQPVVATAPAPAPAPAPAQAVNPYADWASALDPASGKTYYYDTVTGATSWEWPPQ